jgi:putative hydrolase of the HAD superfamily
MYGVIIKESEGNFLPYTYSHFPNIDETTYWQLFNESGVGKISSDEFLRNLGFKDTKFHMQDYLENHLTIDPSFYTCVEQLRFNYKFALLSNDVLEWSQHLRQIYDIDKYFSQCIVSSEVNTLKPDKAIYEIALSRIGVPASECIFVDNSVRNLETARELDIDTILFNRDGEIYNGKTVYSFEELYELMKDL